MPSPGRWGRLPSAPSVFLVLGQLQATSLTTVLQEQRVMRGEWRLRTFVLGHRREGEARTEPSGNCPGVRRPPGGKDWSGDTGVWACSSGGYLGCGTCSGPGCREGRGCSSPWEKFTLKLWAGIVFFSIRSPAGLVLGKCLWEDGWEQGKSNPPICLLEETDPHQMGQAGRRCGLGDGQGVSPRKLVVSGRGSVVA